MSENLRRTAEHDRIVRPRTKIKHEQNREESFQKINQQIQNFEVLQQQERAKVVEQPI
ncbi:unnamed protein product [Arabidopsis lyrata]|uniref:Uncharacterized protein n=1 Tax=Arabidopsis lyrata subsp. lyrata TaxID=81972 RepID=D7LUU9_ARALL|nr:hypothetical protein ARALYDRAFT_906861 [Arabidopsis lyrata subsp. lyrata]CAH8268607.1 unnamed protein product [Arabidopsis lyrata]